MMPNTLSLLGASSAQVDDEDIAIGLVDIVWLFELLKERNDSFDRGNGRFIAALKRTQPNAMQPNR
jgi:hypothetical protein